MASINLPRSDEASRLETTVAVDNTPCWVIQGNECCLIWLFKQFILLFQCCRAVETIIEYIGYFSSKNIQWLTQSQIEGLPDQTIQRLGYDQLLAFTDVQKNYFNESQRCAYAQALVQYSGERDDVEDQTLNSNPVQESIGRRSSVSTNTTPNTTPRAAPSDTARDPTGSISLFGAGTSSVPNLELIASRKLLLYRPLLALHPALRHGAAGTLAQAALLFPQPVQVVLGLFLTQLLLVPIIPLVAVLQVTILPRLARQQAV